MKKLYKVFLPIIVASMFTLPLNNCAAIFKGTSEDVKFNSQPQGAEVYVNGTLMGATPLKLKLESSENYTIEFRMNGFESKVYQINNTIGAGWIILDILAGGLLPIIIDAATGAWFQLNQTNLNAILGDPQNNTRGRERQRL